MHPMLRVCIPICTVGCLIAVMGTHTLHAKEEPLRVAEIDRTKTVEYSRDVLPILRNNCIPCHHQQESEGGLNLESSELIRKGGDGGPAVDLEDAASSLLLMRATGEEEPLMPPEDNSVGAKPLTPNELGVLRLWIQGGAKGASTETMKPIQWNPIPDSVRTIYAIDVADDDHTVAFGLANRVVTWDLNTREETSRLIDSSLNLGPVADVDVVQSVAFSADGTRMATGGYRTVRIWKATHVPAEPNAITSRAPNAITSRAPDAIASRAPDAITSRAAGPLAPSGDQSAIALVNAAGEIEIWDRVKESKRHQLIGTENPVHHLAWPQNAKQLFAVDSSGRVAVWDTDTAKELAHFEFDSEVTTLCVSLDGDWALVASKGKADLLRFILATKDKPAALQRSQESVGDVKDVTAMVLISKPQPTAVLATKTGVRVVDVKTNKVVRTIQPGGVVNALAVLANETKLLTAGATGITKLWSIKDGKSLATFSKTPESRRINTENRNDVNRQKAFLATMTAKSKDLDTRLKNEEVLITKETKARAETVKEVQKHKKTLSDAIAKAAASKNELDVAVVELAKADKAVADNTAKPAADKKNADADINGGAEFKAKAEAQTKELVAAATLAKAREAKVRKDYDRNKMAADTVQKSQKKLETQLGQRKRAIIAAEKARDRATAALTPHKAKVDVATERLKQLEEDAATFQKQAIESRQPIIGMDLNADESRLATLHADGTAQITRITDGHPVSAIPFGQTTTTGAGIVFVGDQLVRFALTGSTDTRLQFPRWELERTIGSPKSDFIAGRVTAIAFHREGELIAVGGGSPSRSGEVKVYSATTGQLVQDFGAVHFDTVLALEFSPVGDYLASASADSNIQLLNVKSKDPIRTLEGHTGPVLSISWNDDSQTIASASSDRSVRIWDSLTGETSRKVVNFRHEITAVDFVGTTKQAVAASGDGKVRLFDANSGRTVRTFTAPNEFLFCATVTPNGQDLLAGSQSGTLWVWKVADGTSIVKWKSPVSAKSD